MGKGVDLCVNFWELKVDFFSIDLLLVKLYLNNFLFLEFLELKCLTKLQYESNSPKRKKKERKGGKGDIF